MTEGRTFMQGTIEIKQHNPLINKNNKEMARLLLLRILFRI